MRQVDSPGRELHLDRPEDAVVTLDGLELENQELRAEVERLRELDQTKSDFVSILAHELNGPMTSVVGFGRILREQWGSLSPRKREELFELATRELSRLARLVGDLLDLSRIDQGTLRYDMEDVSLRAVVESLVAVHSSLTADHEVAVDIPDDLPPVHGDTDRIKQVVLNLTTNAARYSPPATTIDVRAEPVDEPEGRFVRVAVSDEGIGLDGDEIERAFTKFVRIKKPSWVKEGSGLGLYITKGIVEAHGGRIWVVSRKGEGSTFYFTLPAAR